MIWRQGVVLCLLCCQLVACQDDEDDPMDPEDAPSAAELVGLPGFSNVTSEEFARCEGFHCADYDRIQRKRLQLYLLLKKRSGDTDDETEGTVGDRPELMTNEEIRNLPMNSDVILSEHEIDKQIARLRGVKTVSNVKRRRRTALAKKAYMRSQIFAWSGLIHIPFMFDNEYDSDANDIPDEKAQIRKSFKYWSEQTCLQYKEIAKKDFNSQHQTIMLTRLNRGCYASLGKMYAKPQVINLQKMCTWYFGVVIHEIGHAMGFNHEQTRIDRNKTIKVHYENMDLRFASQYTQIAEQKVFLPFDLNSVMLYGSMEASKNHKPTMTLNNPLFRNNMGQRNDLSFRDSKTINLGPMCKMFCYGVDNNCAHAGYIDPRVESCDRCRCPPGFSPESLCMDVAPSKGADCSKTIELSSDGKTEVIKSPGADGQVLKNYQECNWHVKAPDGYNVEIKFDGRFDIDGNHWVEVQYTEDLDIGPRYNGLIVPKEPLVSDKDEMMITFRSEHPARVRTWYGFSAKLRAVQRNKYTSSQKSSHKTTTTEPPRRYETTTRRTTEPPRRYETTTRRTTTSASTNSKGEVVFMCDFDKRNGCGMRRLKTDRSYWTLRSGGNGLPSPHSGRYYAFHYASRRQSLSSSMLLTPAMESNGRFCIEFWYNLSGESELLVFIEGIGTKQKWSTSQNTGGKWMKTDLQLHLSDKDKIKFEGKTSKNSGSYTVFDDLSISRC